MLTNKGEKRDPKTNEAIRTYVRRLVVDAPSPA